MLRALILLLIGLTAFSQDPYEKQRILGQQLSVEFERKVHLLADPSVDAYLGRLTSRLNPATFHIGTRVIDDQETQAFPFPGGFLYIDAGLIEHAHSESELAGILAHEIAHIVRAPQRLPADGSPVPVILTNCARLSGLAVPFNSESEADLHGVEYTSEAGYDPRGLVDYFERLKPNDGSLAEARAKVSDLMAHHKNYVVTSSAFTNVQEHLRTIRPAPKP